MLQAKSYKPQAGFTLIEMIVAVALFAIVMLIAGATLLSLVYANRKAQALQSVINNLNVSLDGMVRNMREGSNYRCGGEASSYGDCTGTGGGSIIYFTPFGLSADDQPQHDWAYVFDSSGSYCGKDRICESEHGGPWIPITSPEVQIQSLAFYVVGTTPASQVQNGQYQQPKVVFVIKGQAGTQQNTISTFDIQATAVQRELNL
ncbi:MAG TPA: type II secretion system protein [Candidatus Paceibacterota bacterium]|jgi:prepilin-type N-terminal cleavage/methylation domain-containing protein|nr:type II secretion system protein [Candidatus Paceibacterota bacterium]